VIKKLRPVIIILFILIIGLIGILGIRFIFGGDEDIWICQKGVWVKHGNPAKPVPIEECR